MALTGVMASLTSISAAAAVSPTVALAPSAIEADTALQLVDVRSYRHCHNMPGRTRCHSKQRLPVNWPPNTNTPGNSRQRDANASKGSCRGWFCRR